MTVDDAASGVRAERLELYHRMLRATASLREAFEHQELRLESIVNALSEGALIDQASVPEGGGRVPDPWRLFDRAIAADRSDVLAALVRASQGPFDPARGVWSEAAALRSCLLDHQAPRCTEWLLDQGANPWSEVDAVPSPFKVASFEAPRPSTWVARMLSQAKISPRLEQTWDVVRSRGVPPEALSGPGNLLHFARTSPVVHALIALGAQVPVSGDALSPLVSVVRHRVGAEAVHAVLMAVPRPAPSYGALGQAAAAALSQTDTETALLLLDAGARPTEGALKPAIAGHKWPDGSTPMPASGVLPGARPSAAVHDLLTALIDRGERWPTTRTEAPSFPYVITALLDAGLPPPENVQSWAIAWVSYGRLNETVSCATAMARLERWGVSWSDPNVVATALNIYDTNQRSRTLMVLLDWGLEPEVLRSVKEDLEAKSVPIAPSSSNPLGSSRPIETQPLADAVVRAMADVKRMAKAQAARLARGADQTQNSPLLRLAPKVRL